MIEIQELLVQAQEAIAEQKLAQAKSIYASALEIDPKNYEANTNLGILNINSNSLDKGLQLLKTALDYHRNTGEAWINYIKYLMLVGKYKNASDVVSQAIKYGARGNTIDQYEILCLFANNSIFMPESNQIILLFLQERFKEIIDLESTLDAKFFEDSSYHYLIGNCLLKLGLYNDSIQRFKKSVEFKPDLVDSYRLLIILLNRSSEKAEIKKYKNEYLRLKSKDTKTKSNLKKTIELHVEKLDQQGGTQTFLDSCVTKHILGLNTDKEDYCQIYEHSINSKKNRFISYSERKSITKNKRQINGLPMIINQGTHSLIKWKDYDLFKTANDLTLYFMILNEVKPEIIIELGSGTGGSAVWMADMCKSLGFDNHIYSYDINKPNFEYHNVTFIEFDINTLDINNGFPLIDSSEGKSMLVIEDAHVNVLSVLNTVNKFLNSGDYLIVEDSDYKQQVIQDFMKSESNRYKVDQFYLDFFGMNMTCSTDSIFRRV